MSGRVLLVEDEALVALAMEDALLEGGWDVCGVAGTAAAALELARRCRPELAVVDVRLAGGDDGIAVAEALWTMLAPIGILFATGNTAEVEARARVGAGCLSKPFEAGWLLAALRAISEGGAERPIPGFFLLPGASLAGRGKPA